MLLRLRSRDGLERIQVDDNATVAQLQQQISSTLGIPVQDMTLSKDPKLLTSKDPAAFLDLANQRARLAALGINHGDLLFMHYPFERAVQPAVKKTVFESRGYGAKMTVEELIAKQTRIERQETPHCASVSFDRHAANTFQSYVHQALAFSIKRGGLLYGSVDEAGNVSVAAIYEPPQQGSANSLVMERGTEEEERAEFIASRLGLRKVGWIFTQSTAERDYIMSTEEMCQMAAMQDEIGEHCVTALVVLAESETGGDVHFEAFQVSDQAVRLWREGWFQPQATPSGVTQMRNPKEPDHKQPVIVAGKDVGEVDNDYFLIPVKILDHEGPLAASFPVENRLLPQGKADLKAALAKDRSRPYGQRIADFHLLLWLAKQPGLDLTTDMAALLDAVAAKDPIPEGYSLIIDSLAET